MCLCAVRSPSNSVLQRHQPWCISHHHPGLSNHRKRASDSDITPSTFPVSLPPSVIHRLTGHESRYRSIQTNTRTTRKGAVSSGTAYFKRQKRSLPDDMPLFSATATSSRQHTQPSLNDSGSFLAPSKILSRKKSMHKLLLKADPDFSSDLEHSFASNVSLNSPPRDYSTLPSDAMDISPMPPPKAAFLDVKSSRPRAYTSGARLFGADISNSVACLMPSPMPKPASSAASVKGSVRSTANRLIGRSVLPNEWIAPAPAQTVEPSSPADDAMDVDVSYYENDAAPTPARVAPPSPAPLAFSPFPQSADPSDREFNQMFHNSLSPRRSFDSPSKRIPKKPRRSLSPDSAKKAMPQQESSPAILPSSPSDAKLERIAAKAKPTLPGLGVPSGLKRPRRPALSAMTGQEIKSAYPVLSPLGSGDSEENYRGSNPRGAAPPRRAFSALLPPGSHDFEDEAESSFDGESADMSSPAQAYSKRQHVKTIRRCDGTEDFRPLTGVSSLAMKDVSMIKDVSHASPASRLLIAQGMPGFGDNETVGKILPCHRVREDGLMRIKSETVNDLLDGKYDDRIVSYHIIDCRFDYEFNGGHIPGAVNINSTSAVEQLLLTPSLHMPKPSVSGDSTKKTILIFHCEFSAKRAPTFAKHLRAKDRAANHHNYPKIHYPEVYILEGGYCQYFKTSGPRCDPPNYVQMDDPNHATARQQDLDQFRKAKFGRHKSYAYGDGKGLPFGQSAQPQTKRSAVGAPPNMFVAAAGAARSRRTGSVGSGAGLVVPKPLEKAHSLMTLMEDNHSTAQDTEEGDTDVETDLGDSPCPPSNKGLLNKGKGLRLSVRPMVRSETYGPSRMTYGLGM